LTGPGNYRRQPYAGFGDGREPEHAPTSQLTAETIALRDAKAEVAMLNHRIAQLERALQVVCRVLQPYSRSTLPRR
jgi:hypothetical protein